MSRHLVTYQKKLGLSTTISTSQVFLSYLRNRGNKEWSKQSNCSILQGTKVGSAKEHNRHISIPQRVSQQSVHSPPSRVIKSQGSWVSSRKSQHSPAAIHIFLTSIPGSLGLKIVPRRYIKHTVESLPPIHLKTSPDRKSVV